MKRWIMRLLRLREPDPVERAEEAAHAKEEAQHRAEATAEVLKVRQHVIYHNHIARDIGRAYALTQGRGRG